MDGLLVPMFVQMGLTFSLMPFVVLRRAAEIRADRSVARKTSSNNAAYGDAARKIANNFDNQFQLPILFYVGVLFAIIFNVSGPIILGAAWVFVGFRIAHTIIHTTYNYVPHRFLVFGGGTLALIVFLIATFSGVSGSLPVESAVS